jgi:hypothetical protein
MRASGFFSVEAEVVDMILEKVVVLATLQQLWLGNALWLCSA